MDFWGEEGFVDDGVGNLVLLEQLPSFVAHPREIAEFDGEVEVFGEDLEEGFQMVEVIRIFWGQLDEEAAEFAVAQQDAHCLAESVEVVFDARGELELLVVGDEFGQFGGIDEVGGAVAGPAHGHFVGGVAVEGGVDFHRLEDASVGAEHAFFAFAVEGADPLFVAPARGA